MISTGQMIDKVAGMIGTAGLSPWETTFMQRLVERKNAGQVTALTEKQLDVLEQIYGKHFA